MDISQLRSFVKIAEHGSFTSAAKACFLSQPALSQQIAKLETELGCPLFERQGRTVSLTDAGETLLRRATQVLSLVDDTARELRDDGATGRVVVGVIPTIAPYFLPEFVKRFHQDRPQARVEIHELVTDSLVKYCQNGEVDLGILALPVQAHHLEVEPLFEESLWLVMPKRHPLSKTESVRIERLRDQPFVLLDEAHCLSTQIRSFCHGRRFQPVTTGRTSQLATVQELVALGHGLSFIPDMAKRVDHSKQRVYREIVGDPPRRTIAACWNGYRYQSKLARAFLEMLRAEAGLRA